MTKTTTVATLLADAKAAGYTVTRANCTLHGKVAFNVSGYPCLFSKDGLMRLVGIYA